MAESLVRATVKTPEFGRAFLQIQFDTLDRAEYGAHIIGREAVNYLRSLTDKMQPPARKGEGMRPAHPGGWADVRGTLALSYGYEVLRGQNSVTLRLYNSAEYAVYLELKDGYYVLSGIMEPGGPVDTILRERASALGFRAA